MHKPFYQWWQWVIAVIVAPVLIVDEGFIRRQHVGREQFQLLIVGVGVVTVVVPRNGQQTESTVRLAQSIDHSDDPILSPP